MRLWSIHPKYLDQKGLCGLWVESLLAQKVLQGKTKGYKNHPQLERWKDKPSCLLSYYLLCIAQEATKRGYNFDCKKIKEFNLRDLTEGQIPVTRGQINYEFNHLQEKLKLRNFNQYIKNQGNKSDYIIEQHPVFKVIVGDKECWERG